MDQIRMLHTREPGYNWFFSSPDLPGLTGGGDPTLAAAKVHAESAARFHVECVAEENGEPVPDLAALEFVHFVPDTAATLPAAA